MTIVHHLHLTPTGRTTAVELRADSFDLADFRTAVVNVVPRSFTVTNFLKGFGEDVGVVVGVSLGEADRDVVGVESSEASAGAVSLEDILGLAAQFSP